MTGRMVRRWRQQKCWSHADLAKKLGVSRPCIAQWEAGKTAPAESRLRDLARVFGVSVPDFYRGPTEVTPAPRAGG